MVHEYTLCSERADLETLAIREQAVPERPSLDNDASCRSWPKAAAHRARDANRHRRPGLPVEAAPPRMVGIRVSRIH